jgi:hypothetical protein
MKKNQSYQNVSFKDAFLEAIKKFDKSGVDILSILNFEYPFRKFFYIEQALSSLIVNSSDAVIGTYADSNNYYKYSDKGIKLISNERNNKLRLEKKIVFKEAGGFSIYNYSSYLNNKTSKITNVIIDKKHSFAIFNNDDIFVANQLIKKINL